MSTYNLLSNLKFGQFSVLGPSKTALQGFYANAPYGASEDASVNYAFSNMTNSQVTAAQAQDANAFQQFWNNMGVQKIAATAPKISDVFSTSTPNNVKLETPQLSTSINPVTPSLSNSQKFGQFMSKNGAMIGQIADAANGLSDAIFGQKRGLDGPNAGLTQGIDSAADAAGDIAMKINPMVGGIIKAGNFLGNTLNKVGGGTDGMTKTDAVLNSAPLTLATLGLNGFLGSTSDSFTKNEEAFAQVGSSYGGTGSVAEDALSKANKKYGLLSGGARKEANSLIREAKRQQSVMSDIADDATTRTTLRSSMSAINGNRRAFAMQGGYNQSAIRAGKAGLRLQKLEEAREKVLAYRKKKEEFKEGGSINVIPDGALHARKHNMDVEGITHKGIPVVSEKEGGELEQQAEIEREEIIFRLEVTKKLEELAKDGSDEAAIEAGKLLAKEILYNTQDNTGLLNE